MAQVEVDFTFDEAVRTLGVTPERLEKLIEEGRITVINDGVRTLVPRESILAYLATVTSVGKVRGKK
jgi:excisionase family DNA binding protein